MIGLIGKKLGMTRQFQEDGRSVPVTVIEAGPCVVTQVKTEASDGYSAVQLGFGAKKPKNTPMPMQGHFRKAGTDPLRTVVEFRLDADPELALGDKVSLDALSETASVDASSRFRARSASAKASERCSIKSDSSSLIFWSATSSSWARSSSARLLASSTASSKSTGSMRSSSVPCRTIEPAE